MRNQGIFLYCSFAEAVRPAIRWFGVKSENTITNHVQALINRGVVDDVKNLTSLNIKNDERSFSDMKKTPILDSAGVPQWRSVHVTEHG